MEHGPAVSVSNQESEQAKLNGKSEAVGITATPVNTKQVLLGQRPVTGNLAVVQIKVRGLHDFALGI